MDPEAQLVELRVPAPKEGSVLALMARFSEGEEHARRRAIAERRLADLEPGELRTAARDRTLGQIAGRDVLDVMTELARAVPVAVLAAALGATDLDATVAATRRLCLALAPPVGSESSDGWTEVREVATLLGFGGNADQEEAINVVALLFQAMDATAGFIGNALRSTTGSPAVTVVRTARVAPDGTPCLVDLASAEPPLPFGAGRHRCPGEAHAVALAAGVLDALKMAGATVVDAPEIDEERLNLRIPVRVVVRLREADR